MIGADALGEVAAAIERAARGRDLSAVRNFDDALAQEVARVAAQVGAGQARGRSITVADIVEAISSHRPYRASLGMPAAIEEITAHRGTFYDPEVVDACLKVITDPNEDIS